MVVERSSKNLAVSDVSLAAERIRLVAGNRGPDDPVKVLLERAYSALVKINRKWTRRRVRALWKREAARVDYREIAEMDAVLSAARRQHADFIAETERLAAIHLAQDADFYGPEIEARRSVAGRVDRA